MNIRKIWSAVLASAILVASAMVGLGSSSVATAQAASASCGVKVFGPTFVGPPTELLWAYTVRNTCQSTQRLRVYLPTTRRHTLCSAVDPGGYHTYTIGSDDARWEVRGC